MIRVIAIAGKPGTGKSALMHHLRNRLARLGVCEPLAVGLLAGETYANSKVIILGKYAGQSDFPGTDRLSMAVQPTAQAFLTHIHRTSSYDGYTVIYEGDRLTNSKLFSELGREEIPFTIYVLETSDAELQRRYRQRGSNQPASFVDGRETKIRNMLAALDASEKQDTYHRLAAETQADLVANAERIWQEIREGRSEHLTV